MGMRAGEAGEAPSGRSSEDRPLNARGDDVERDTQVPEVHAAAEARAGDGQLARRALDRRALPRARHQRVAAAALARAGAGGRDGALRRAASSARRAPSSASGSPSSSARWAARPTSWRSRESSCGTGSRHARHPVPRAGRRGLSARRRWRAWRRSAARRSTASPKPRRAPASPARPPADEVEAAIVAEAEANPTDGYRLVTAWVRRRLGPAGQPQAGAARDARAPADPAPPPARRVGAGRGSSASSAPISSGIWT